MNDKPIFTEEQGKALADAFERAAAEIRSGVAVAEEVWNHAVENVEWPIRDTMTPDFATPCETCAGRGWIDDSQCPDCDGLGLVPSNTAVEAVTAAIARVQESQEYFDRDEWSRAAISALIEHTGYDDEFGEPLDDPSRERIGDS